MAGWTERPRTAILSFRRDRTHPSAQADDGAPPDQRIRRSWWIFAATFILLAFLLVARLLTERRAVPRLGRGRRSSLIVGVAAVPPSRGGHRPRGGRRAEAESFARILSGLSRSVSEDAIVGAIVEELADASRRGPHRRRLRRPGRQRARRPRSSAPGRACRRRRPCFRSRISPIRSRRRRVPGRRSRSRSAPTSGSPPRPRSRRARAVRRPAAGAGSPRASAGSRVGSISAPVRPAAGPSIADEAAQAVADRIADQVRSVYGLTHMLAAPLDRPDGVIGRHRHVAPLRRAVAGGHPAAPQRRRRARRRRRCRARARIVPPSSRPPPMR